MHVAADVDKPQAVQGHGNVVMAVPADGRRKIDVSYCFRLRGPHSDGHASHGVVVGNVLAVAPFDKREIHRMARPDVGHFQGILELQALQGCGRDNNAKEKH